MGYVLPITNYQGQHYQDRVTQPARDPYPIERLYSVQLDMAYSENADNRGTAPAREQRMLKSQQTEEAHQLNKQSYAISDDIKKVYSELTGTGLYVNEVI